MSLVIAAPSRTQRVCVVAERLTDPLDEGGRKFAHTLAKALETLCDVRMVSVGGEVHSNGVVQVPFSRTFAGSDIRRTVSDYRPDIICYVPSASLTLFSIARARMLKLAGPRARVAVLATQPRQLGAVGRALASRLRPDVVLVLDAATGDVARRLGLQPTLLQPAVDIERYRSVDLRTKMALREKLGLAQDDYVVLHVGHAKRERGIEVLADLAPAKTVLVAASSEGRDDGMVEELRSRGVTVIDRYVPAVQEIYQAADSYVFPVFDPGGAIGAPLSVLEAMACNLSVITTRFGALPGLFSEAPGYRYVSSPEEIAAAVQDRAWAQDVQTRTMVSSYTWENAARQFLRAMEVPA